jgi:hypothetical protein
MGDFVPANMIRLKVINPSAHWDAPSHGSQRFEHQVDDAGNVFVIVPVEAVRPLLRAGYAVDQ